MVAHAAVPAEALTRRAGVGCVRPAEAVLHVPGAALAGLVAGAVDPRQPLPADVSVDGDPAVLGRLLGALDPPDPDFAIVTP